MKRAVTLIVIMVGMLFFQSAFAQIPGMKFQAAEGALEVLTESGDVQPQAVLATGLKISPLQAFTTRTSDQVPYAWWDLDAIPSQEYYLRALFTATGSGTYYARIKVTDVKTGYSIYFPKEGPYAISAGYYTLTSTPISAEPLSGVNPLLPRPIKLTYQFKVVGTTVWKGVSTLVWYY